MVVFATSHDDSTLISIRMLNHEIGEERRVNRRTELVACAKMVTTATNKVGTLLVAVLAVHYCCLLAPWDERSTKLLKREVILGAAPFMAEAIGNGRGNNMVC